MNFDQLIGQAINYVPGGLALALLYSIFRQALGGQVHFNSEVDGLRQDKKDLFDINRSTAAALESANKVIADQNVIIRDGIHRSGGR